jgi:hypothetical protein
VILTLKYGLRRAAESLRRDPLLLAAVAGAALLVAGLQIYGGAYSAEFTGHADEAAHFVSSLLVRDYLGLWPPPAPLPWAREYYLHYPKVAIGHWPPGYYIVQALWWLLFPVSRASALWLNVAMSAVSAAIFYVLARRIRPGWPAAAALLLLLIAPVVQESNGMVLADLPALLAALIVLWTLTRLLEDPGPRRMIWVAVALAVALAVKGTGAALCAAPVLAVTAAGVFSRLRLGRTLWILAGMAAAVAGIYLWQHHGSLELIRLWGGMTDLIPWRIDLLPTLAGRGCLAVAAGGVVVALYSRQPAALASAALLLSLAGTSYFVRAMREQRHFIAALPVLLLLSLVLYGWLERRRPLAALSLAAVVLVWFPFSIYRQQPQGFGQLAAQVRLPARMLVSSAVAWSEGSWIAAVALREHPRPQSTILRATKILASTDWNRNRYRPLAANEGDIERILDETALDVVVLDNAPEPEPGWMPHHKLLRGFLAASPAWGRCGEAGQLEAYCRKTPPRYPRRAVRIPMRTHLGYDLEEK